MSIRHASRSLLASLALVPTALGGPTATEQALETATRLVLRQCRLASFSRETYWTSQPGALRTFDRGTGALQTIYKLYSSPEFELRDPSDLAADRPADWASQPAHWVDLNAPSTVDGDLVYPVADPRADAEGFSFDPSVTTSNPLPMPVAWLYLTLDGTLGSLDASHRFTPLVNPHGRPKPASADNPLVARVGWWADDATCKINLNTASEGVFWDTPRCDTEEERAYGRFQPARGEWQRDMGHPAAVCLSTVLFPGHRLHLPDTASGLDPLPLDSARLIWQNAPGIPDAGSLGGTRSVNPDRSGAVEEPVTSLHDSPQTYTSQAALPPDARIRAARGGFFLTGRSRAPDFTRDGLPRLSLWPLSSPDWRLALTDPARVPGSSLTEFDALLARVTALRARQGTTLRPMAVVRSQSDNQRSEAQALENGQNALHASLLNHHLSRLRLGPHRFDSKYGAGPFDDLLALASASVSSIRDVHSNDPTSSNPFVSPGARVPGTGQVTPLNFGPPGPSNSWSLPAGPFPRGLGRFPTVSEVALIVSLRHRTRAGESPRGFFGSNQNTAASLGADYDHFEIEVGLLIEGFVPAQGGGFFPRVSFALGGYGGATRLSQTRGQEFDVGAMSLNGQPLVFPSEAADRSTASALSPNQPPPARWNGNGGSLGVRFLRDLIAFKPLLFSLIPGTPAPRLEFSGSPTHPSQNHLRLLLSHSMTQPPTNQSLGGNLVQMIPLAFPEIRGGPPLPFDDPTPVPLRGGNTHRLALAQSSGLILGPLGLIHDGDIVQSLVPAHGDFRLVAARQTALLSRAKDSWNRNAERFPFFVGHPNYGRTAQAHALTEPDPLLTGSIRLAAPYATPDHPNQADAGYFDALARAPDGGARLLTVPPLPLRPDFPVKPWSATPLSLVGGFSTPSQPGALSGGSSLSLPQSQVFHLIRYDFPAAGTAGTAFHRGEARPDVTGDFDNGIARTPDGPFVNATDPGDARAWAAGGTPYFDDVHAPWVENPGTYSPYRQMPSALMLGSLPTGIQSNVPWQTLLFRPDPGRGTPVAHHGSRLPADHLFADFFRMPVVKPSGPVDWTAPDATWMPSDTFSTDGRVNMNCEIIPFAHIRRSTALHAVLKAQKMLAIPDEAGAIYKSGAGRRKWRHHIDATETLRQWRTTFAGGDVFRTASEITEQWLVPEGVTLEHMPAFWARHRLTGDNSKERPYANIYPHLTTRSLTFDLHVVIEEIVKAPGSPPDLFVPSADTVHLRSQHAVSVTGRIDPLDPLLPDYAGPITAENLDPLDMHIHWSSPNVAPPQPVEPVWLGIQHSGDGRFQLSWKAAPDQLCGLEISSDLQSWTPVGAFRTGEWRDLALGQGGVLADLTATSVLLPINSDSSALHARLRWTTP